MPSFVHAADLHLDSPLRGLERHEGAPVADIQIATRRALENLVELAIDRRVDAVVLAGDLYDGNWDDYHTGLFFTHQMGRLREADIPVVAIAGNHDAISKMTRSLPLPDNFQLLGHQQAETASLPKLRRAGLAIHGRSFGKQAERERIVVEYPPAVPGMFNIGLLHTSLSGSEGHDPYAPCTIEDLHAKQYDYWALGHVHQRQIVSRDPWVIYSGNTQGRHIRETGEKGCYVVEVHADGSVHPTFHALDVVRWVHCQVDAGSYERPEDVLEDVESRICELLPRHEGRLMALRVEVGGPCRFHERYAAARTHWDHQVRGLAAGLAPGRLWIEKVRWTTRPWREQDWGGDGDGPIAELLHVFREVQGDEATLRELRTELHALKRRLPPEAMGDADGIRLDDLHWLRTMLGEVEPMLVGRLQGGVGQ
ncbi:MAG: phosphoesterase [Pirellulaceae bacterium]|nr:MAG: phosphoesterase [Pirellulaceae bacterium]